MQFLEIGKIIKSHGVKGKLLVIVGDRFIGSLRELRAFFIDMDGSLVPFLIEDFEFVEKASYLVRLKGVESKEEAVNMHGKSLYINEEEISGLKNEKRLQHELVGFILKVNEVTELKVVDVVEYPQQLMMVCRNQSEEQVLIPFVEGWIVQTNADQKTMDLNVPEGLV